MRIQYDTLTLVTEQIRQQESLHLPQLDMTLDLKGTFYCFDDITEMHKQLGEILDEKLKSQFTRNRNSYASCF